MHLGFRDPRRNQVAPKCRRQTIGAVEPPGKVKMLESPRGGGSTYDRSATSTGLEQPLLFPLPVFVFFALPFIVKLLAFGESDL